jgi:polyisoprenoid-binding protein YceI
MSTTKSKHRSEQTISGSWQLDAQRSSLEFRARSIWGLAAVKGRFSEYQGRLDLSAAPAIELTIDAASLDTGNRKRDEHLRSADFFDVENHPRVRFVSESVQLHGDTLKVHGRLTTRDRSIPLELDAEVDESDGELEIAATTIAPHRDLGMTYSPLGMIPPRSKLIVKAHLVADAPPAA